MLGAPKMSVFFFAEIREVKLADVMIRLNPEGCRVNYLPR